MIHFRQHMEWFLSVENTTLIHVWRVIDVYALQPLLNKTPLPPANPGWMDTIDVFGVASLSLF